MRSFAPVRCTERIADVTTMTCVIARASNNIAGIAEMDITGVPNRTEGTITRYIRALIMTILCTWTTWHDIDPAFEGLHAQQF